MKKQLTQVKQFHNSFGVYSSNEPSVPPQDITDLRIRLLEEEVGELRDASRSGNLVECADAIVDCLYVLLGAAHAFGFQDTLETMFSEVHRSNMSKLGSDGKPILRGDGKVVKGVDWSPPDLEPILTGKK